VGPVRSSAAQRLERRQRGPGGRRRASDSPLSRAGRGVGDRGRCGTRAGTRRPRTPRCSITIRARRRSPCETSGPAASVSRRVGHRLRQTSRH
jgi:hypothetical protein